MFGILRGHGGQIEVGDAPGGGARFCVRLPRTEPGVPAQPQQAPRVPGKAGLTVLIAEDEAPVRAVLRQLLEAEGHTVIEASDGLDAVASFRAQADRIDLLLFDVRMPRMSGPEAIRRIRARGGRVPAILVSGYARDDLSADGQAELGVELLAKPYSRTDLVAAILRVKLAAPGRATGADLEGRA